MEGPHRPTYKIEIDESQRLAIVAALTAAPQSGPGGKYLLQMFSELPDYEKVRPRIEIHGFCY